MTPEELSPTVADAGAPEALDAGGAEPRDVLTGERLRVRYGEQLVLDVDRIALREGEMLAVLGPNGSGKSTLMRVLALLEQPTSGQVRYRGLSGKSAERALRRSSAAVFQRPYFWREPVSRNIGLGLRLRGMAVPQIKEHVHRVASLLGIDDLLQHEMWKLSGGEAQRVALARALVLKPEVLFLDEPTANLDAPSRLALRDDLEQLARQRAGSVLLITHDRNEAFYLADRIAVLVEGRLTQVGTPTDLYENPADPYIAHLTGAEFTLRGRVLEVEEATLLVDIDGTPFRTVGAGGRGGAVKVAYRPEDLVLAPADSPAGTLSTRNDFFATVTEVRELRGLVRLRLAGPPEVVAVVTRSAAEELELVARSRVRVRVKATALHAFPAGHQ